MKTPSSFSFYPYKGDGAFNFCRVWLFVPSVSIEEDYNFDTIELGTTHFELDLSTGIKWTSLKDFWSVSVLFLGFGFTINRQTGY